MSVESRVEILGGLSRGTFETVYVEYEGQPPCLRIRSKENLYPLVFRLVVYIFSVFELLTALTYSYNISSTTTFLKYRLMVLLVLEDRYLIWFRVSSL